MELVEKKLALLENESQEANNGEKVLRELSQMIKTRKDANVYLEEVHMFL